MGPAITAWLEDPAIVEVMLNPDGRLWIDRLAEGLADTGKRLSAADGERIVRLVAHHVGAEVHPGSPRVSAELPETGERFEGLIPPIVAAPAFAIRKPAVAIFIYRRFGLNDRQIEILTRATPKRGYYCQSRRGNRLFELGLGEVALAFAAASSKADQAAIADVLAAHGRAGFAAGWLRHKGLDWAVELLAPAAAPVPAGATKETGS